MESIAELREKCQPKESEDPIRLISIYVTKLFLYTPITANQTTLLFIVVGMIAVWLFTDGSYWKNLLGAALLLVYVILDRVDGEIARYRGSSSEAGVFLDSFGHALVNSAVFAGIGFGIYHRYGEAQIFIPSLIAVVSVGVLHAIRGNKLFVLPEAANIYQEPKLLIKRGEKLKKRVVNLYSREIIHNSILWASPGIACLTLLFSLIDKTNILLLFYAITTPIYLGYIIYLNFKRLSSNSNAG